MTGSHSLESALSPYRVLDLAQGGTCICGKILGDLGADVIKIEPPGGDPTRNTGPFYKDIPDPEKSLFWFAYNTNKRGITLNLESRDGQQLFRQLAKSADFVIESFKPSYLDDLGLGYSNLSEINPRVILVSITPFGQDGPYAQYEGPDLVCWAMSGYMATNGDPDRAPVWVSLPQAYLHAGAEAATAAMIAHHYREAAGEGQHVDVSAQECVIWLLMDTTVMWDVIKFDYPRAGACWQFPNFLEKQGYPCKDGYIHVLIRGGAVINMANSSRALVKWMDEEGFAPEWLKQLDWTHDFDTSKVKQELVDRVEEVCSGFFLSKTKTELWEQAMKRNILLAPVGNAGDILGDPHFEQRDFWVKVAHPELRDTLTYPGAFLKMSETPWRIRRRAPLIGEHNQDIYLGELGLSREELVLFQEAGVI